VGQKWRTNLASTEKHKLSAKLSYYRARLIETTRLYLAEHRSLKLHERTMTDWDRQRAAKRIFRLGVDYERYKEAATTGVLRSKTMPSTQMQNLMEKHMNTPEITDEALADYVPIEAEAEMPDMNELAAFITAKPLSFEEKAVQELENARKKERKTK
jgi:hypothetical protein